MPEPQPCSRTKQAVFRFGCIAIAALCLLSESTYALRPRQAAKAKPRGKLLQAFANAEPLLTDQQKVGRGDAERRVVLSGGEAHYYSIELGANFYLNIELSVKNVDAMMTLFAPDGRRLVRVTEPVSNNYNKNLLWETTEAGTYYLEIRPRRKDATAGLYRAVLRTLLPLNEQNRDPILADRNLHEAMRLRYICTEKSLRESLDKFEAAAQLFHALSQQKDEVQLKHNAASSFVFKGESYHRLSEHHQAIAAYERAFEEYQPATIDTSNSMPGWANANLGQTYLAMGETDKAIDCFNKSLAYYIVYRQGQSPDRRGQAIALTHLGTAYLVRGDKQRALDYFHTALPYWQEFRETNGEARIFTGLAALYLSVGDAQQALELLFSAASFFYHSSDLFREGSARYYIGKAYATLGNYPEALKRLQEALQVQQLSGHRQGEANTLTEIGLCNQAMGDSNRAFEFYNGALELLREVEDRRGEGDALNAMGTAYYALGNLPKALSYFNVALPLRRFAADREGEGATLFNLARVERDNGNLEVAQSHSETALKIIESVRATFLSEDWRAAYLATMRGYYEFHTDLLMRRHKANPAANFAALALEANEQARARSLLEMLALAGKDSAQPVSSELLERKRSLQRQLNDAGLQHFRLLTASHSRKTLAALPRNIEAVEKTIATIREQLQDIKAKIKAAGFRPAAQLQTLSTAAIQQQLLDNDTLLLEYALGDERSYLWVVSQQSLHSFELPSRTVIEAATRRLYTALTERNRQTGNETAQGYVNRIQKADGDIPRLAAELGRLLLDPAAALLAQKRLLIVADGALQYVPFAALPEPSSRESRVRSLESKKNNYLAPNNLRYESTGKFKS